MREQYSFARRHIGESSLRLQQALLDEIRKALIVKPFDPVGTAGHRGDFHWALLMVRRYRGIPLALVKVFITFVGRQYQEVLSRKNFEHLMNSAVR